MSPPQYFGDPVAFLREWAVFAHQDPSLGLHSATAFERLVEDLLKEEASRALTVRDLHRDIGSLEANLKQVRGY